MYTRNWDGRQVEINPQNTTTDPPGPGEQVRPVSPELGGGLGGGGGSGNIPRGPRAGTPNGGRGDLPVTCPAAPDLTGADKS